MGWVLLFQSALGKIGSAKFMEAMTRRMQVLFFVPYSDKHDYNALVFELNEDVMKEFLRGIFGEVKENIAEFFCGS